MSNNEKQPTPVEWLMNKISFHTTDNRRQLKYPAEMDYSDYFNIAKQNEAAREKELVSMYEKKIFDLMDKLVQKQDELIAFLKKNND